MIRSLDASSVGSGDQLLAQSDIYSFLDAEHSMHDALLYGILTETYLGRMNAI